MGSPVVWACQAAAGTRGDRGTFGQAVCGAREVPRNVMGGMWCPNQRGFGVTYSLLEPGLWPGAYPYRTGYASRTGGYAIHSYHTPQPTTSPDLSPRWHPLCTPHACRSMGRRPTSPRLVKDLTYAWWARTFHRMAGLHQPRTREAGPPCLHLDARHSGTSARARGRPRERRRPCCSVSITAPPGP